MRKKRQITLQGIPVSPGIVIGRAFVLDDFLHSTIDPVQINPENVERETARFRDAVEKARDKIRSFRNRVLHEVGNAEAKIFDSHLSILADPEIIGKTIDDIREKQMNAEYIFRSNVQRIGDKLRQIPDAYIRERCSDIDDVARRVINNLMETEDDPLANLQEPVIVVAHDIAPSDTANMTPQNVIGFATDRGGPTSHTAIMANAIEIPAVVGCENLVSKVSTGDQIIVDGIKGIVTIQPSRKTLSEAQHAIYAYQAFISGLSKHEELPAETMDGYEVGLAANIELPEEVKNIRSHGIDSIGLFRTEFLYLNRPDSLPSEDEQFEVYRSAAAAVQPHPVIIRTLDLGGDKFVSTMPMAHEINPYLGMRAIRLCLQYPELFKQQLRAMLRASMFGKIRILFPMICSLDEVRWAKQIYEECRAELRKHKIAFKRKIDIGIMIETPAAAVVADQLAEEVDFFSIGTNDLIQYTLAVDRGNERVAHLYDPFHPAVLRLIHNVIRAAQRAGIWVAVCGEAAGDPLMAALLVGLGVDELSMSPIHAPIIKEVIRHMRLSDIHELAGEALHMKTGKAIRNYLFKELRGMLPHSEWFIHDVDAWHANEMRKETTEA